MGISSDYLVRFIAFGILTHDACAIIQRSSFIDMGEEQDDQPLSEPRLEGNENYILPSAVLPLDFPDFHSLSQMPSFHSH